MELDNLAVQCWRYLAKDGANALPLKQRIPEVGLFHGDLLEACYHSNQRGILQRRAPEEATCEALLDRLLGPRAELVADLTRNTPVAILRHGKGGTGEGGIARESSAASRVVLAGELMDLLDTTQLQSTAMPEEAVGRTVAMRPQGVGPDDQWSLQGVLLPSQGVRHVAVYSRSPSGEETIQVSARPLPLSVAAPVFGAVSEGKALPPEQVQAVEAKTLALVRYLQRFHRLTFGRLVAEFLIDAAGRKVLNGFENIALMDPETAAGLPEESSVRSGGGVNESPSLAAASAMSTEAAGSASASWPTSAANTSTTEQPSSVASGTASAGANVRAPMAGSTRTSAIRRGGSASSSRPTSASGGGAASPLQDPLLSQSVHIDEQIPEEGDEDFEESIERACAAAARPSSAKGRRRARPGRRPGGRPTAPVSAASLAAAAAMAAAARPRRPFSARARLVQDVGRAPPPPPRPAAAAAADEFEAAARLRRRPTSAKARISGAPGGDAAAPPAAAARPAPPAPVAPQAQAPAEPRGWSFQAPVRAASARASPAVAAARQHQQQQQEQHRAAKDDDVGARTGRARSCSAGDIRRARSGSPKAQVFSRQLFSRYDKESETRPRMMSLLARQLERLRECTPWWFAQREALTVFMWEQERQVANASAEVGKFHEERDVIEKAYVQRYDQLVRGLHKEQEKAAASVAAKKKELEKSLELERETTHILKEEEARSKALKCTLERTVGQLEAVRSEMIRCQAAAEQRGLAILNGVAPRIRAQQQKIEAATQEKMQLRAEARAVADEIAAVQDELIMQRSFSANLEEFVRRLAAGSNGGRYALDGATRREAQRLIAAAARRRPMDIYILPPSSPPPPARPAPEAPVPAPHAEPAAPPPPTHYWDAWEPPQAPPVGGPGAMPPPGFEAARRAAEDAVLRGGLAGRVRSQQPVAAV